MSAKVLFADGSTGEWPGSSLPSIAALFPHPNPSPEGRGIKGEGPAPEIVTLSPTDDPAQLIRYLHQLELICIEFPKFTDGRGYSIAALLRRLGYRGELRAVGDVLVDQVFMLRRVGFTSFALRADQDVATAVAALGTYSDGYQAAADSPLPHFRRRAQEIPIEAAR